MQSRSLSSLGLALALFILPVAKASAAPLADPAGDFLDSYTGPHGADLDIISIDPTFDGSTFTLQSTSAGAIGTTPGAVFVWGVDRGTDAAPFGAFRPGVKFDALILASPSGPTRVSVDGVTTILPSSDVTVSGNSLSVAVPLSLLPSKGFSPMDYLVNLWPRSGSGGNSTIADFAPDNSDAPVSFVPEPATIALCLAGFAGLFATRRQRLPAAAT